MEYVSVLQHRLISFLMQSHPSHVLVIIVSDRVDVVSPRTSPYCNYVYRLVSQVYISWWDYVFIRPESLGVKGQEPDFVYVIMQIINKI
jgi:hypothetical protein